MNPGPGPTLAHRSRPRLRGILSQMHVAQDRVGIAEGDVLELPHRAIERIAEHLEHLGSGLLVLVLGALAAYIGYKFFARRRFLRELRIARITEPDG